MKRKTKKTKSPTQEQILFRYWKNLKQDRYFIKGQRDSTTKEAVLAARGGNYFGPETVFWAFVHELPNGTYYVDGE